MGNIDAQQAQVALLADRDGCRRRYTPLSG
jgi:hypothetical protein